VAVAQVGLSGDDVARAQNLTPPAISKLVLRACNDPVLKDGVNNVLNLFWRSSFEMKVEIMSNYHHRYLFQKDQHHPYVKYLNAAY